MKKASDNLVRAAQKAAFEKSDEDNVVVKTKFVGGIAQVMLLILKPVSVALKNKSVHSGVFSSYIVSEICPSYPLAHTSLVTSFTNNFSFSFFSTAGQLLI